MEDEGLMATGQDELDFSDVLRGSLHCAVISTDADCKINGFNAEAEELLELKRSEALGQPSNRLPTPVAKAISETFSSARPVLSRQIFLQCNARGEQPLQINTTPVFSEDGRVSGVVAVLNDLSPAKRWESNMRRLDRLHSMGALSASMAHEVKNAFVAVKTFVDLLLEQNQQADLAEIVRSEMTRIESILSQMRTFSKPVKPAFSLVHVHAVLEKALQLTQHLLASKKIKVSRSFAANPDSIRGDQVQLEQAFINLLFNALDALSVGGHLDVSTELISEKTEQDARRGNRRRSFLRILIRDDGCGVSPENLERLFEPFFTTKPDGTGLGLAITRRILQEHGGEVEIQSEVNKGTALILMLPCAGEF